MPFLEMFAAAAVAANDVPARPGHRRTPIYPATCPLPTDDAPQEDRVNLGFNVNRDGELEDLRVLSSTRECFEDASLAAARTWRYEPRRVDGKPRAQEELEVTILYRPDEETGTEDFDARPLLRRPPRYPKQCLDTAKDQETVFIEFDVTTDGATENPKVIEATSRCFEASARASVEKWTYRPAMRNGTPVRRKGAQVAITFELAPSSAAPAARRVILNKLFAAQRDVKRRRPRFEKAAAKLEEVEATYGDSFNDKEMMFFHQVRAQLRIAQKDYRGALADLQIVKTIGPRGDLAVEIDALLNSLKAATAQSENKTAEE
ncbi:MAG: energy transducer TonB [Parvularculaceae bacterium]